MPAGWLCEEELCVVCTDKISGAGALLWRLDRKLVKDVRLTGCHFVNRAFKGS